MDKIQEWINEVRKIYIEEYDYTETTAQLDTALIIIDHLMKAIGSKPHERCTTGVAASRYYIDAARKAIEACEKEIS